MPCPRTTILSRSVSSETRQGQADFSRRREPIAFRRWSARAQSFLYIYQEGPVGARGKREAFSKRLWKTPLHVCTCSQPFPKRLSRPEFPAFSTIAAASIGHALQHKSDPPKRQENPKKDAARATEMGQRQSSPRSFGSVYGSKKVRVLFPVARIPPGCRPRRKGRPDGGLGCSLSEPPWPGIVKRSRKCWTIR